MSAQSKFHLLVAIFALFPGWLLAQCTVTKGPWVNVLGYGVDGGLFYSVHTTECKNGNLCGWPIVAIYHTFGTKLKSATIVLRGRSCTDGKVKEASFYASELESGKEYNDKGNWHNFMDANVQVVSYKFTFEKPGGNTIECKSTGDTKRWDLNGEEKQRCGTLGECPLGYKCDDLGFCEELSANKSKIPCGGGGCPPGYECISGFCNTKKKESTAGVLPCTGGRCPPGYECVSGFCKTKKDNGNEKNAGPILSCSNGSCPPGYGCKHGNCVKGYVVPYGYINGRVTCGDGTPYGGQVVGAISPENRYKVESLDNGYYSIGVEAYCGEMTYTVYCSTLAITVQSPCANQTVQAPDINIASCEYTGPKYAFAYGILAYLNSCCDFHAYIGGIYDLNDCDIDCLQEKLYNSLGSYARGKFDSKKSMTVVFENKQSINKNDMGHLNGSEYHFFVTKEDCDKVRQKLINSYKKNSDYIVKIIE